MTGRLLLAGASGYIGRAVAHEATLRELPVTLLVRPGADLAGLEQHDRVEVEVTDRGALTSALAGRQYGNLISCLASRGGAPADAWRVDHDANMNLLALAENTGINHFQLLSAICVQKPRLEFQRAKLAFEEKLEESEVDHTIVRPTAFFKSLAGQVARVQGGKPFLVFGDGSETACKPIGEADLARFMLDAIVDPARRNRILPIGGPGPAITPREQGELLFELLGRPAKIRSVPVALFDVALSVLGPLARWSGKIADKAEFARIGRYYATESMLLWDAERECYDAGATPETGSETLRDFYSRVLEKGMAGQELGAQKMFK